MIKERVERVETTEFLHVDVGSTEEFEECRMGEEVFDVVFAGRVDVFDGDLDW